MSTETGTPTPEELLRKNMGATTQQNVPVIKTNKHEYEVAAEKAEDLPQEKPDGEKEKEEEEEEEYKKNDMKYNVYLNKSGEYYAAETPKDPGDSMIPYPSKNLLEQLSKRPGETATLSVVREELAQHGNGEKGLYKDNTGIIL